MRAGRGLCHRSTTLVCASLHLARTRVNNVIWLGRGRREAGRHFLNTWTEDIASKGYRVQLSFPFVKVIVWSLSTSFRHITHQPQSIVVGQLKCQNRVEGTCPSTKCKHFYRFLSYPTFTWNNYNLFKIGVARIIKEKFLEGEIFIQTSSWVDTWVGILPSCCVFHHCTRNIWPL